MAAEWRALDDKGKEPYVKMAAQAKEKYEADIKDYNASKGKGGNKKAEKKAPAPAVAPAVAPAAPAAPAVAVPAAAPAPAADKPKEQDGMPKAPENKPVVPAEMKIETEVKKAEVVKK